MGIEVYVNKSIVKGSVSVRVSEGALSDRRTVASLGTFNDDFPVRLLVHHHHHVKLFIHPRGVPGVWSSGPVLGLGGYAYAYAGCGCCCKRREDITEIYECIIKMIDKKVKIFINITNQRRT